MQTHDGLRLDVTTYRPDDAPVTVFPVLTVAPGAGHVLPLERDRLVSATLVTLLRPHVTGGGTGAAATAAVAPSRDLVP